MIKKLNIGKERLKIITSENIHPGDLAKIECGDWNSFFENGNTVDEDFMNEREDVIESSTRSIFDDE